MSQKIAYRQYMYTYPHKLTYTHIDRLDLSSFRNSFVNKNMSLYIHIPFCKNKCGYCNLFSTVGISDYDKYVHAVFKQSKQMNDEIDFSKTKFNTIVLGGGTPLLLSSKQLEKLFELAVNNYSFDYKNNFSVIETSPKETTHEKISLIKDYNFKRISIGVQSFVDDELKILQRNEHLHDIHTALNTLKKFDFECLNIDLIYGMPNQSEQSFIYSLQETLKYSPDEIFLYPLYNRENAGLFDKFSTDRIHLDNLYKIGSEFLKSNGYNQNSMRNFSKKPATNKDCGFENNLALGCGGRSYFNNLHFCENYVSGEKNSRDLLEKYMNKNDFLSDISYFLLNIDEQKRKYVIKNVLYSTGLNMEDYHKRFDGDLKTDFPIIEQYIKQNMLVEKTIAYF